jgi:Peptidase family C25
MNSLNKILFLVAFTSLFAQTAYAQMPFGRDTLYGAEWIDYNKTYFRLDVATDGIYRLTGAALASAGVPNTVSGNQFQIFRHGREIPIFTSNSSTLNSTDYIEFYGQRNRWELDTFCYPSGAKGTLNPEYSLINDTTAYFLTWSNTPSVKRYALTTNNLANAPAAETQYQHTALYHAKKYTGTNWIIKPDIFPGGAGVYMPEFRNGEGFGDYLLNITTNTLDLTNIVPNTNSKMYARWSGNYTTHITRISLNGEALKTDTTFTHEVREFTANLSPSQTKSRMQLELKGLVGNTDYSSLAIFSVEYARTFNFENKTSYPFKISASNNTRYLEIKDFKHDGVAPILYDLTNSLRIVTQLDNNVVKVILPPSVSERNLVLVNTSTSASPIKINPQIFKDLRSDAGSYIIIAHKRHLKDNSVSDYANYRASAIGGNYKTTVVDIDDIYAQFGYGTNRHPISIRNYIHFIKKNWANPKYIVLIGKAKEYRNVRDANDLSSSGDMDIPTWGYPGSDGLLAANNKLDEPTIPIGRIPITTTADLKTYLDKVREHETDLATAPQTITARDWRKQVIHLSGGASEREQIKNILSGYENNIGKSKFGGNVSSFYKTNLDPVQVSTNDQIFARLAAGASITTFFGHSGAYNLDFDINSPEKMTNKGKYPIFLALGCAAANTFQTLPTLGESFIFYKERGMIAFLGTTGLDYLHSLNQFSSDFYTKIGESHYGKTIGEISKATIGGLQNNAGVDLRAVLQEWVINGDPALRITRDTMTDYIPDPSKITFEPATLNAQLDSFKVNFDIINIGSTQKDSFSVLLQQQLPNGTLVESRRVRVASPAYRNTYSTFMPLAKGSAGQNRLMIRVDNNNNISELPAPAAEANNDLILNNGQLGVPFSVLENSLRPIFPPEYGIANKTPITLIAQTSDPLAKNQTYIIQIDTIKSFNSPLLQQTKVTRQGGIIKWQPSVNWRDSTVYYWRTTLDSTSPQSTFSWQNSSFTFIRNSPSGWSQAHFQQFQENQLTTMRIPDYSRQFDFSENVRTVSLKHDANFSGTYPRFFGDGSEWGRSYTSVDASLDGSFYVSVLDSIKVNFLLTKPRDYPNYGATIPINSSYVFRMGDTSQFTGRRGLVNFLKLIPPNAYVLVYTSQSSANSNLHQREMLNDSTQGASIVKILEAQGATKIRNLANSPLSLPYGVAFRKDKGILGEYLAPDFQTAASIEFPYLTRWFRGDMQSKWVGPAKAWGAFEIKQTIQTNPKGDSISYDIIGYSVATGRDTVLFSNIIGNTNLSNVSATNYPYLKVKLNAYDDANRTAPQLHNWRILYTGMPDFAVNPDIAYSFKSDSVTRGEPMSASIGVENITGEPTDSVEVKFVIRDELNTETQFLKKYPPLSRNGNLTTSWELNSKELKGGKYQFEMVVNPNGLNKEAVIFNNYLQKPFTVQRDLKNPLLDVTFDGLRIMNNDLVAAKPTIRVELKDENQYLLLQDTTVMQLALTHPKGNSRRIFFNEPALRFTPANNRNQNKAAIEYKPNFTEDGTYQLEVKSQDASGNVTANIDYKVSFKIYRKSSIANVLNYPNPFSTRTQFVYTLTGETPPTYFRIQIMTVAGKVVREITQDELGLLRIGTHRTDYVWDGTDEYGNKLANGVYLYRVVAKDSSGKSIETYSEKDAIGDMSSFFKKGIGKLVIMR